MKLLIITSNPHRASFRQRIEVYIDTLQASGIACEVAILPPGSNSRRKLFKRAKDFDGVFLHKKGLNPIDGFWLRRYSKKIIYNFDDAVMYNDRRPNRNSRSHFRPFRRSTRLADMVIVGNSYLAEHAQRFNSNVKILPIGLQVSDYKVDCSPKDDDKIRLIWIGSESTLHYLAGMKPILEEIGARFDNVILRIICDNFLDLENMPLEKQLWSKDTRSTGLATSDIGLAPLPSDRFTKGKSSFKILEYASSGLPVVASPIGTNSDHLLDNVTGFLVTTPQEWIDKITQLIKDAPLRKKMGQQGRMHAEKFDVSVIGKQLIELITQCLQ